VKKTTLAENQSLSWQSRAFLAATITLVCVLSSKMVPWQAIFHLIGSAQATPTFTSHSTVLSHSRRVQGLFAILSPLSGNAQPLAVAQTPGLKAFASDLTQIEANQQRLWAFTVPKAFQGKTIERVPLNGDRKVVALTFDDGPWPKTTNDVLYILNRHNVKATFFFLGRNVQNFPDLARRVASSGHAIANHSWSHPYGYHNPAAAAQEIDHTDATIEQVTGVKSALFRPPGGYLNTGLAAYAAQKKQVVVMWSADSKDYYASSPAIVSNVLRNIEPGGIILLHDGGGDRAKTVAALPILIRELRDRGYEFVTVPELLELSQEAAPPQQSP
jgi:peptidoglycan/xylan/chitin deacetylase (PgdA/CDA1 family)